jgi:glycosyltransferase involved in cell wall biosynthesis
MKTFICTNILTVVDAASYITHCNFWYRLGRTFPKDTFFAMTPPRMAIDQARNWAAKMAMQQECDYLMFIDDDALIAPDTLASLISADLDIVMAHTYIRGYPFHVMAFKRDGEKGLVNFDDYKEFIGENGVFLCDAVGFHCALIKVELLKKMEPPYFLTGTHYTEDIYFCVKARKEVSESVSIGVDTRVPTGHLLHKENVSVENVERLRTYYSNGEQNGVPRDRGQSYYEQVSLVLGHTNFKLEELLR